MHPATVLMNDLQSVKLGRDLGYVENGACLIVVNCSRWTSQLLGLTSEIRVLEASNPRMLSNDSIDLTSN